MSESNPLINIVAKNPADFSFGLIGVPMALAAANIAEGVAAPDLDNVWASVALLVVLSFEFAVATLLCVYVFHEAVSISRGRLIGLMLVMLLFSLIFIVISVVPPCTPWYFDVGMIPALLWICLALLAILCIVFARDLRDHMVLLVLSLAVAEMVMCTTI